MGFSCRRSQRYVAYLWACFLSCLFVLSFISPAQAQTTVTWEALQTHATQLRNPYEHLSTAQTYRLSNLYKLREWVKANQPGPESIEQAELERLEASFEAEGIDADELLKDADAARAYWAAKSRSTNVDILGRPIFLNGYVLPLNVNPAEGGGQGKQMHEFLLVPYVGACIHVPAPPPNQMVYVKTPEAVENPGTFAPVQVEGELQAHQGSYELFLLDGSRDVDVSYKMSLTAIAPTTTPPPVPSQTIGSLLTLQGWRQLPTTISNTLTTALNQIQSQKSPQAMFFALLLSFSYGVLHTLGPGHGKAVIVSYFVGQGGSLRRGLRMGGQIAIFHVLSAILLVIFTDTVVRQIGGTADSNYRVVQLISYGAIALLGGWMLRHALTHQTLSQQPEGPNPQVSGAAAALQVDKTSGDWLYPSLSQQIQSAGQTSARSSAQLTSQPSVQLAVRRQATSQNSDRNRLQNRWPGCSCLACGEADSMSGWLAMAVGAIPCSGALLVLLYGLANNMLWQSVAMVLAISIGMAMTLAWIGIMAILTHRWGVQIAQRRLKKKKAALLPIPLTQLGRIVGASCVCLLGSLLFAATWMTGA